MPIYMDLHILPGIKAKEVAEAHRRDMLIQDDHRCKCMTYWIDEKRGNVFCLIEAPTQEAVEEMHKNAHGLIPNKIIEVNDGLVESFLGRISDPDEVEISTDGLKVFSETSFRILLVTAIEDTILLQYKLGKEEANALLKQHNDIIRKNIKEFAGTEVENERQGFIVSFVSASKAIACAIAIRDAVIQNGSNNIGFKMSLHAGDPVTKNENLFGDTIKVAENICYITPDSQVFVSAVVKDLIAKDYGEQSNEELRSLSPSDESFLELLFDKLEQNWQDTDFNVSEYCNVMAMSKSQLYRKTMALSGSSPNELLKEYRLDKARALMKKKPSNITQVTFDTGFNSPSYFTKCFKKKYGLLPMAYLNLLYK